LILYTSQVLAWSLPLNSTLSKNKDYKKILQDLLIEEHDDNDGIASVDLGDPELEEKFSVLKEKLRDLHRRDPHNNLTTDKAKLKKLLTSLRDRHFEEKARSTSVRREAPRVSHDDAIISALKDKIHSLEIFAKESSTENDELTALCQKAHATIRKLKAGRIDDAKKDTAIHILEKDLEKARISLAIKETDLQEKKDKFQALQHASKSLVEKYSSLEKKHSTLQEEHNNFYGVVEKTQALLKKSKTSERKNSDVILHLEEKNSSLKEQLSAFEENLHAAKHIIKKLRHEDEVIKEKLTNTSIENEALRGKTSRLNEILAEEASDEGKLATSQKALESARRKISSLETSLTKLAAKKEEHQKKTSLLFDASRYDKDFTIGVDDLEKRYRESEMRRHELEVLLGEEQKARLALEEEKLFVLNEASSAQDDYEGLQGSLSGLKDRSATLEEALTTTKEKLFSAEKHIASLEKNIETVTTEKNLIAQTFGDAKPTMTTESFSVEDKNKAEESLLEKSLRLEELSCDLNTIKAALSRGQEKAFDIEKRYDAIVEEKASLEERYYELRTENKTLTATIATLEDRIKESSGDNDSSRQHTEQLEQALKAADNAVAENKHQLSNLHDRYDAISNENERLNAKVSAAAEERRSLEKDIEDLHETVGQLDIIKQELRDKEREMSVQKDSHNAVVTRFSEEITIYQKALENSSVIAEEKSSLEGKHTELSEKFLAATMSLQEALDEKTSLEGKIHETENVVKTKDEELQKKATDIEEILDDQEKLENTIGVLQKKVYDKDLYIKQAQHHMAKKVKENTMLQDYVEKQKVYSMQLQNRATEYTTTLTQQQDKIKILTANEERMHAFVKESVKTAEEKVKHHEEQYSSLNEKYERNTRRMKELEQVQGEYQQLKGVFSNIKNALGVPQQQLQQQQQPQQQNFQNAFDGGIATDTIETSPPRVQQEIFGEDTQQDGKHKENLF
jgi:chromosome segregation protein